MPLGRRCLRIRLPIGALLHKRRSTPDGLTHSSVARTVSRPRWQAGGTAQGKTRTSRRARAGRPAAVGGQGLVPRRGSKAARVNEPNGLTDVDEMILPTKRRFRPHARCSGRSPVRSIARFMPRASV